VHLAIFEVVFLAEFTSTYGNERLQLVKNFKNLTCKTPDEKEKDVQQKLSKSAQILANLKNNFKPNLVQKFSIIKAYNALARQILL